MNELSELAIGGVSLAGTEMGRGLQMNLYKNSRKKLSFFT